LDFSLRFCVSWNYWWT